MADFEDDDVSSSASVDEVADYLHARPTSDKDVLTWWKEQSSYHPKLATFAWFPSSRNVRNVRNVGNVRTYRT